MIVAGIGSRKNVRVEDVLAAVETALKAHGLALTALSALATTAFKQNEGAIFAAGRELGLPVVIVHDAALGTESADGVSRSGLSQTLARVPSVSEAAALGAAGAGAKLLGPRIVLGSVTCAIASGGEA